jgi:hypothetical protein
MQQIVFSYGKKLVILLLEENHFFSRLGASQESKYYTLHSTNGEHGTIRSGQLPKKKERRDRDGHTPIFGAKQL